MHFLHGFDHFDHQMIVFPCFSHQCCELGVIFSSGDVLCQPYRNLAAAQLYAGRSEEQHAFGIKKKGTAMDIGE